MAVLKFQLCISVSYCVLINIVNGLQPALFVVNCLLINNNYIVSYKVKQRIIQTLVAMHIVTAN